MPITYESVCSGIEAATQPWHSLGMRAACFAEMSQHFAIASSARASEH